MYVIPGSNEHDYQGWTESLNKLLFTYFSE